MSADLIVPSAIEAVINRFDQSDEPFIVVDVGQWLIKAHNSIQAPTEDESLGARAEVLAFTLAGNSTQRRPWGTYFGPAHSGIDESGKKVYIPDIVGADPRVLAHWASRARSIRNPILKARYADLAWDLGKTIARTRPDPEMARLAIDAYLASSSNADLSDLHNRFEATLRALDLAIQINDQARRDCARSALMALHREALNANEGLWWLAFDRLVHGKKAGTTDAEKQELVESLEALVLKFGDSANPQSFDPHAAKDAAELLIRHYSRLGQIDDVRRLGAAVGQAFKGFAALGAPELASVVLPTAIAAYRDAGLPQDSARVRVLLEEKIRETRQCAMPIEIAVPIPESLEESVAAVVGDDFPLTLSRIAARALPSRRSVEEQIKEAAKAAPLTALMPRVILEDDHIAGRMGSVHDDPLGRSINHFATLFRVRDIWLEAALKKAINAHTLLPEHFVAWANRRCLFEDVQLLFDGVGAWYNADLTKAVHVLVPRIEHGLRAIVGQLGKPRTKPHPTIEDVSVAKGMGDILYDTEIAEALGPDLTFHFLAIYADPRGINLRNRVAHGLIRANEIDGSLVRLLIHTLLVFGIWKELAEKRR